MVSRRLLCILMLALVLSACGSTSSGPQGSEPSPSPTSASTMTAGTVAEPTATPDPVVVSPTEATAASTGSPLLSINLVNTSADPSRWLHLIDPVSLEPLPGFEPIELRERRFAHTFSPDGQRLALLTQPMDFDTPGALYLVDLSTWDETVVELGPLWGATAPHFDPEGQAVYWMQPGGSSYPPGGGLVVGRTFALQRYDLQTEELTEAARLPATFTPFDIVFAGEGDRLAVFGAPVGSDSLSEDDAEVVLLNHETGAIEVTLPLDGMRAGSYPFEGESDPNDQAAWHLYHQSLTLDPDRKLLYIAHPDGEVVSVVDLQEGEIRGQHDISAQASWGDRFMNWLVPRASAVARAITRTSSALGADGNQLFVAIMSEQATVDRSQSEETTVGDVTIVDTQTWDVTGRLDLGGVQGMVAHPDGEAILVQTHPHLYPFGAVSPEENQQLHLIDSRTGEVRASLDLPGRPRGTLQVTESHVYVQVFTPSGSSMLVIDAHTLELVGEHTDTSTIQTLLIPPEPLTSP